MNKAFHLKGFNNSVSSISLRVMIKVDHTHVKCVCVFVCVGGVLWYRSQNGQVLGVLYKCPYSNPRISEASQPGLLVVTWEMEAGGPSLRPV